MAKPLVVIAIGGFAIAALCWTLASAIGGDSFDPFAGFDGPPFFAGDEDFDEPSNAQNAASRDMTWDGDDVIEIDIPALVRYQPGAQRHVTLRGDAKRIDRVRMRNGHISYDRRMFFSAGRVEVILTAPTLRRFVLNGPARLLLQNIKQEELDVVIRGPGFAGGSGEVDHMNLSIAGPGHIDFGQLVVGQLKIDIEGPGHAVLAPKDSADIVIMGPGNVRLTSRPIHLQTHIMGPGRIVEADAETPPSAPPK